MRVYTVSNVISLNFFRKLVKKLVFYTIVILSKTQDFDDWRVVSEKPTNLKVIIGQNFWVLKRENKLSMIDRAWLCVLKREREREYL